MIEIDRVYAKLKQVSGEAIIIGQHEIVLTRYMSDTGIRQSETGKLYLSLLSGG